MRARWFTLLTAVVAIVTFGGLIGPAGAAAPAPVPAAAAVPATPIAAAVPAGTGVLVDPWANLVEEPLGTFPANPAATKWAPTKDGPSDLTTYPVGTTAPAGNAAVQPAAVQPFTLTVTVTGTADQDIYTLTPDVLGTLTSSAGGTVQGFFYVRTHGSGTWNLANAAEVDVASGTVASWRFADQMGTPGGLYDWQMKACQSSTCSALTTIVTFEINPMVGSGSRTFYGYYDQKLSAAGSAHVNYATGDLAVSWNDLSIGGVNGLSLGFGRTYNSITDETIGRSDFGSHWTNALTDPYTAVQSSGGIRLQGPSGYLAEFSKRGTSYISPSGLDADVVLSGGSTTTMTFHHNADGYHQGDQLVFVGNLLQSIKDKHGNSIGLAYYTGGASNEVKTITDNQTGRSLTLSNYNAAGQAQTVTDNAGGRTVTYTYDGSGNLATFSDAGEETITGDASTQYVYDSIHELTQITDPAGRITKIGYTSGQVTSYTAGFGTTDAATTTFAYYPVGDTHCATKSAFACTVVAQDRTNTTPTVGPTYEATTYYHDQSGRITFVFDNAGNSQAKTWDVNSNVIVQTDKLTNPTITTVYDGVGLNNPLTATDATGATDTLTYTGSGHTYQPDTQTLPNNQATPGSTQAAYTYVAAGSSTSYGDVSQAVQGSTTLQTSYQGDGSTTCSAKPGEVCTTTNGKTGVTSYGYDTHGNLTSITPPAPLVATSDTVDALGRVATSTDGLHQVTAVHYDVLDRVSEVDYPASSKTIKYTYDGDGHATQVKVITGTTATYTFTYDNVNRLTHKTLPANTTVVTDDAYGYDKLGNLRTLAESGVTGGHTLSLTTTDTYNNLNLVQTVSGTTLDPSGFGTTPAAMTFTQDNDGRVTNIAIGSAETRSLLYDNAGREVKTTATKVSGSVVLSNLVYCYINPVSSCPSTSTPNVYPTGPGFVVTNNKQQVVDLVGGTTVGYTYDGLNRLTDANTTTGGTDHRSYGYDADANRTSQTINGTNTTYTYNTADQATTTGYTYDADGNGTVTPTLSNLTYNPLNQATAITKSGTTTNFAYSGATQDIRTTANNIDAALSSLGTDIEASPGSVYHFYIRGPIGNLLAIVNDNAGTLTTRYPILDGIGSVIGLTNGTGTVDDTWKYDPYGIVLSHTGTDYNPFGYANGYTDTTTGLIHFGARYDNPADGRFTQQDPSGQEANLYTYTANPINGTDPSGRFSLNFSFTACYFVCGTIGISTDSNGNSSLDGGIGVGNPSVSASVGAGSGNTGTGVSVTGSCSIGNVSGSISSSGDVGASIGTSYSTGQCDTTVNGSIGL